MENTNHKQIMLTIIHQGSMFRTIKPQHNTWSFRMLVA